MERKTPRLTKKEKLYYTRFLKHNEMARMGRENNKIRYVLKTFREKAVAGK